MSSTSEYPIPKYRPEIDGLRALAVLSVVGFHAFPGTVPGGFVGVDVFFVISGFLISSIIYKGLEQGNFRVTHFYARRIRRIFPALLIMLTACMVFGWLTLLPDEYEQLGKHTAAGAAFVSNFALWMEAGYFDPAAEVKPLLHLWSLGIEEQFYIFWPLLLVILWKRKNRFAMIALLFAASFALNVAFAGEKPDAKFYLPITRFWELLVGCILAYVFIFKDCLIPASRGRFASTIDSARRQQWLYEASAVLGVALIIVAALLYDTDKAASAWWIVLPTLGAALVIAAGPDAWMNCKILARPLLVFVGFISYPLYLWHWPIFAYIRILAPGGISVNALRATKLLAIAVSLGLSWCTYECVERRVRYSKRSGIVHGLCVSGGVVFSIGFIVFSAHGFLFRTELAHDPFILSESNRRSSACVEYFGLKLTRNDYCLISQNASADSHLDVLIGDSQANGLFPALALAASHHGRGAAQLGGAGCFPAEDVQSFAEAAGGKRGCSNSISWSLQIALHDPRVERVFIAGQWAYYFSGGSFDDVPRDHPYAGLGRTGENRAAFRQALRATLDKFNDTGKEVYFVHQIPELGFDPKECLRLRPINIFTAVRNPCIVATRDVTTRQEGYRRLVQQLLLERGFVRTLDPVPMLCDDQTCEVIRNGVFLYRNKDHLSVQGAPLLESLFWTSARHLSHMANGNR